MPRKTTPDRTLFGITAGLLVVGIAMVGSASSYYALSQTGMSVSWAFLLRQGLFAALGFAVMLGLMRTDYHVLARRPVVYALLGATTVLLLAVFLFGSHKGVNRWIPLGPFSIQPSEIAKFTIAVFLAYMVDRKGEEISSPIVGILPSYAVAGLFAGLVLLEPDLGTAAVLVLVTTLVLFVAGMNWRYLAGAGALGTVLLLGLIVAAPYRMRRLTAFLHPESDLLGANFQLNQSLIALGKGGLIGSGFALGRQKFLYLPESHTDFIYSVIGEEFGLVGTLGVLLLFLVFLWRGVRASLRAPDRFGAFLAVGITMFLVCQALINIAVATGCIPTKGMPLPFVSYGGSSLVVSLAMTGVLLNVSQQGG